MFPVIRKRQLPGPGGRSPSPPPAAPLPAGALPPFAKALGMDFIVTEQGQVVLVELQHGFGKRGMLRLWPGSGRLYRQHYWRVRREQGRCWALTRGLREICSDKAKTYRLFADLQPRSRLLSHWSAGVERWLATLGADFVLATPPRGSCGRGILVLDRRALLAAGPPPELTRGVRYLLQEFVRSRSLLDAGGAAHVGCVRHILILTCRTLAIAALALPPYWRLSPAAYVHLADYEALTANISRGAHPLPVDEADAAAIREVSAVVAARLVGHVLGVPGLRAGASQVLQALPPP